MRRFLNIYKLLIFVLLTALLLVACERPVPGSEPADGDPTPPVAVPTTAVPVLPTQIPVEENTGGEGEQPAADPAAPTEGEGYQGEGTARSKGVIQVAKRQLETTQASRLKRPVESEPTSSERPNVLHCAAG